VAIVRDSDGTWHALGDTCSHEDYSLSEGDVEDGVIECWKHGATFDLASGDALTLPATEPVPVYAIEITGENHVGESVRGEFIALINYGIIGLIQLAHPFADTVDITPEEATALYEQYEKATYELMLKKNHDYGEAWRDMRVSSYTDFILTKIERVKEIENIKGATLASEGIDANYMDIIIYAVFGAIKLSNE